jgi:hypothetical protein
VFYRSREGGVVDVLHGLSDDRLSLYLQVWSLTMKKLCNRGTHWPLRVPASRVSSKRALSVLPWHCFLVCALQAGWDPHSPVGCAQGTCFTVEVPLRGSGKTLRTCYEFVLCGKICQSQCPPAAQAPRCMRSHSGRDVRRVVVVEDVEWG